MIDTNRRHFALELTRYCLPELGTNIRQMIRTHYVSHDAEKAKRACLYCYYGCSRRCLGCYCCRYFITSFVACIDATVAFSRFYYGHGDRVEERKQVRIAHVLSQNTHRRRLRSRNSFCLFLRYFTEPSWTRKPLWCSRYHFIPMMKTPHVVFGVTTGIPKLRTYSLTFSLPCLSLSCSVDHLSCGTVIVVTGQIFIA